MSPDAFQVLPDSFRSLPEVSQGHPDASRCFQMCPDAFRCLQMPARCLPVASRCFPDVSDALRCSSRCFPVASQTSRCLQMHPSQMLPRCLQISKLAIWPKLPTSQLRGMPCGGPVRSFLPFELQPWAVEPEVVSPPGFVPPPPMIPRVKSSWVNFCFPPAWLGGGDELGSAR